MKEKIKMNNTQFLTSCISTYMQMFKPRQEELPIDKLFEMPENEEVNGPFELDDSHNKMAASIKLVGQNADIIVFPKDDGTYWMIDRVRVVRAMQEAGFKYATCTILQVDYARALEVSQVLNSGRRKLTFSIKARRLALLEKHAKQYIKDSGDREASELTVRQYMATILQMSERSVSEFKAICAHPESEILLDHMDKGLMKLHKAAAIARNKTAKIPALKKEIPLGKREELACEDCPRRKKFMEAVDNYGEAEVVAKEVCHD